jgi:two-component system chemotaxis response regulator CheB
VRVVDSVFSGDKAMQVIGEQPVDLVTLDLEMPGMDGMATLQAIGRFNRERPNQLPVGVIMISSHTQQGAHATVSALQGGAFDFIPKPSGTSHAENMKVLGAQLADKITGYTTHRANRMLRLASRPSAAAGSTTALSARPLAPSVIPNASSGLRGLALVGIGVSTGGPKALGLLLPALVTAVSCPIVIVQHMPPGFTASLAESLDRMVTAHVAEAREGEQLLPGMVRVAPGGKHLLVERRPTGALVTQLSEDPLECGCRPAANVLFRSVAKACGSHAGVLVLTGMGQDGTEGAAAIKRSGGWVLAQDEASSVVWGMPGSIVAAGLADAVGNLEQLPGMVTDQARLPRRNS